MGARWVAVCSIASALACGGKAQSERRGASGGASSSTGGTATGGSGGSAGMVATGGSSVGGSNGVAGNAAVGGSGLGGVSGSSGAAGDPTGGNSPGGEGGATGGTAAGGEGGAGNCVDVCTLHGGACCIPNVECVSAEASCIVEVLAEQVSTTYDYATLEQRVAALPQDLLFSFTDADVAWAAVEPAPAARIEFHMTPEFAALHRAALEFAYNIPFRVSCNGQPLFVGVFYPLIGAAALDTPVFHAILDEEDPLILRLGARQGAWPGGFGPVSVESRQRIDRAELRGALCLRGPVRELEATMVRR